MHDNELATAEHEHNFSAPPEFRVALPQLRRILESVTFLETHPGFRAVTVADMKTAWNSELPTDLVPFCLQQQLTHNDYYCFQRTNSGNIPKIVVFADHAIVYNWQDVAAFLQWLELQ